MSEAPPAGMEGLAATTDRQLSVRAVSKSFGGVLALDGCSFEVAPRRRVIPSLQRELTYVHDCQALDPFFANRMGELTCILSEGLRF